MPNKRKPPAGRMKPPPGDPRDFELVFRPWITTPAGKVIYASWYGRKAFPIWVKKDSRK